MRVSCGPLLFLSPARAEEVRRQALYVAVAGENAIALVDLAAQIVEKFPVEGAKEPHAVALSQDRKTIYVGNVVGGKVVVDAVTKKTMRVVEAANSLCGMTWSPDRQTLYLTDMKDGRIYQLNPTSEAVIGSIPVAERLCGLDCSRDRKKAFTGNMIAGGQVVVLDWETKKVIEKIPVGTMPHHSGKIVDQISGIGPRACDVIFAQ